MVIRKGRSRTTPLQPRRGECERTRQRWGSGTVRGSDHRTLTSRRERGRSRSKGSTSCGRCEASTLPALRGPKVPGRRQGPHVATSRRRYCSRRTRDDGRARAGSRRPGPSLAAIEPHRQRRAVRHPMRSCTSPRRATRALSSRFPAVTLMGFSRWRHERCLRSPQIEGLLGFACRVEEQPVAWFTAASSETSISGTRKSRAAASTVAFPRRVPLNRRDAVWSGPLRGAAHPDEKGRPVLLTGGSLRHNESKRDPGNRQGSLPEGDPPQGDIHTGKKNLQITSLLRLAGRRASRAPSKAVATREPGPGPTMALVQEMDIPLADIAGSTSGEYAQPGAAASALVRGTSTSASAHIGRSRTHGSK